MNRKFSNFISKAKSTLFLTSVLVASQISTVNAADPTIVTGAKSLASDVTKYLLILIPIVAGGAIAYQALMKMLNDDPASVADRNKKMKNILVAAAIGESASAIVTAVLAYF